MKRHFVDTAQPIHGAYGMVRGITIITPPLCEPRLPDNLHQTCRSSCLLCPPSLVRALLASCFGGHSSNFFLAIYVAPLKSHMNTVFITLGSGKKSLFRVENVQKASLLSTI